mgnify:CR=1 FL=1
MSKNKDATNSAINKRIRYYFKQKDVSFKQNEENLFSIFALKKMLL